MSVSQRRLPYSDQPSPRRYRAGAGKGAYGIVASANDVRTNQKVAIKKIGNM
jgi:hypothetical protein